ncbi:hypothetical protein AAE026_31390 [Bradyrhizobium sp. DN5]|uniref:hypothetical protein n=1 Tax=Bradyrhizobium sp. DN5 TaxID=3056950 RepID=UPI0035236E18
MALSGGNFGKALVEDYVKPFEAKTGVTVTQITQHMDAARIATMVQAYNVTADSVLTTVTN